MMIPDPVHFKTAFIYAGGNKGGIGHGQGCNGGISHIKGFLNAQPIGGTIRFIAQCHNIAAQVEDGALDALLFQKGFQPVRDIAFGDAAQVQRGLGICQRHHSAFYLDIVIIHMREKGIDLFPARQCMPRCRRIR